MSWQVILDAAEGIRASASDAATANLPIAGIGWATVDHERAQLELDGLLGADPVAPTLLMWELIEGDGALGASAWVRHARATGEAQPVLVVLEPNTEGLLAAFLARHGEGVGVVYLGQGRLPRGRLEPGGGRWGPHAVVLSPGGPGPNGPGRGERSASRP